MFERGLVEVCITEPKANGTPVYEADGAWWLRSTDYGDDKDRVVLKSDGAAAYIAGDIAYPRTSSTAGSTTLFTCSAPTTTATSCG